MMPTGRRESGASTHSDRYSLELMRDDVIALVQTLGWFPVALVGHSLGGVVAYLAAAERPDLFDRRVLEETPAPMPCDPPRVLGRRPEGIDYDWAAAEAVCAQRNHPDPRWWDRLTQVRVPVLVVSGGPASHLRPNEQRDLADRFPDARMVILDAGHLVHAVRPVEFAKVVADFLDSPVRPSRRTG